jgi:hypothetical protein
MIESDEPLILAHQAVANLKSVLLVARRVHSVGEYRTMSEPIIREIRQREQEIVAHLNGANRQLSLE